MELVIELIIEREGDRVEIIDFTETTLEEVEKYVEELKLKDKRILSTKIAEKRKRINKKSNESRTKKCKLDNWRKYVLERDQHKCQLCNSENGLHVHHIKKYADYENLQTDVNNGITLCEECHRETYRKEEKFETIFIRIILNKILVNFGIEDINDIIDKNN